MGRVLLRVSRRCWRPWPLLFHRELFRVEVVGLSPSRPSRARARFGKALLMTVCVWMLATIGEGALFNPAALTIGVMALQSHRLITLAMAMVAFARGSCIWSATKSLKRSKAGGTRSRIAHQPAPKRCHRAGHCRQSVPSS